MTEIQLDNKFTQNNTVHLEPQTEIFQWMFDKNKYIVRFGDIDFFHPWYIGKRIAIFDNFVSFTHDCLQPITTGTLLQAPQ